MSDPDTTGVIVVGDLDRTHGYFSRCIAGHAPAAVTTEFDNRTEAWTLTTADGHTLTGRVLVDTAPGSGGIVAEHAMPNRFRIPGPHTRRQARYVAGCIEAFRHSGAARIEARSRVRVHRLLPTRGLSRFYLTGTVGVDEEVYDGPAVIGHDGHDCAARVRMTGRFDPIDGQYHWQGTLYADLPGERTTGSEVSIRIGEHTSQARISEQTPWRTLSVVGVAGYPPFPLENTEVILPPRV